MMQTQKPLIVYGGAFNPPTAAHFAAIRTLAARQDGALVLLPSGAQFIRQWKADQTVLPDAARLAAREIACPGLPPRRTISDRHAAPDARTERLWKTGKKHSPSSGAARWSRSSRAPWSAMR